MIPRPERLTKLIRQSVPALLVAAVLDIFAGSFLGNFEQLLLLLPGLIILIPGAIDTKGAIYASLGSRLGSNMHLGTLKTFSFKDKVIKNNSHATMSLNLTISVALGFAAWLFTHYLGITTISLSMFIFISVLGGILSGILMLLTSFFISFKSYSKGWDPDNVVSPLISSMGDFITIPSLLIAALIAMSIPFVDIITVLFLAVIFADIIRILYMSRPYANIIKQSFYVLIISGLLSSAAGILLQAQIENFALVPSLLVLFPALIAHTGNIGNIFSSRISTKFHLGTMKLKLKNGKIGWMKNIESKEDFIISYINALVIFPFITVFTYIISFATGLKTFPFFYSLAMVTAIGLIITTIIILVSYYLTKLSLKFDWDPDNILIPAITGIADFLGILMLVAVFSFMF